MPRLVLHALRFKILGRRVRFTSAQSVPHLSPSPFHLSLTGVPCEPRAAAGTSLAAALRNDNTGSKQTEQRKPMGTPDGSRAQPLKEGHQRQQQPHNYTNNSELV